METNLSSYAYNIPKELIAQKPLAEREGSRLMVFDRRSGEIRHLNFKNIIDFINPGDCLVLNKTKVLPARVFAKKETGGKVEVFFLEPNAKNDSGYLVLLKPFIETGKRVFFEDRSSALISEHLPTGETVIKLEGISVSELFKKYGVMPLPPYIKRQAEQGLKEFDKERYQTVFAKEDGSIAAPTAGLHFTEQLLNQIKKRGIKIAEIILHVGRGTFKPIVSKDINNHKMLSESFEITKSAADAINETIKLGGRVIACGTTSVRALESAALKYDGIYKVGELKKSTDIFIYPGYSFKIIGAMITNFHLPQSTPLMMASAFAGRENILNAYKVAINNNYRFFSYGDAMLIV